MTHVIEVDDPQGPQDTLRYAGKRNARLWLARRMGDGGWSLRSATGCYANTASPQCSLA